MRQTLPIHRFFTTILFLAVTTLTWAYDFAVKGIYYENTYGTSVTVTYKTSSDRGYSGSVVIPSTVTYGGKTYSVTRIGSNAFDGCTGLKSVTIPESVTSIGSGAFYNCSGLTKAEFASIESLCKIEFSYYESNPLYYAKHLYVNGQEVTDVVIPNSITSINDYAFSGCTGLTSVTIPNSVTNIGNYAFRNCSSLTSVTIPESVTSIGSYAFRGTAWYNNQADGIVYINKIAYAYKGTMPSGTDIVLKEGTLGITDHAFDGCTGLTSVTIPNSVTSINDYAFSGCSNLTKVTLNSNSIVSKTYIISNNKLSAIFGSQVKEYILGDNITAIGGYAFSDCTGLTSITIPNSVTSIGNYAFQNCTGLTSVTIPNSVTSIGYYAFRYCSGLTSVTFGTGLLSIGNNAFGNTKPTKVIWLTNTPPSGYKEVAGTVNYVANNQYASLSNTKVYPFLSSMFKVDGVKYVPVSPSERTCDAIDCSYSNEAENIVIGKTVSFKGIDMTVRSINQYTCYQNPYIKNIILNNIGNIGSKAFAGCIALQTATIQSTGTIDDYAFNGCTALTAATLGKNITGIGSYAFQGCSSLQDIIIPNAVISLGSYAFSGCSSLGSVQIGSSVASIGAYAFSGCKALPAIEIPGNVTSIGNYTFSGCTSLKTVIMDGQESVLALGSNGSSPLFSSCPLDSVYIDRPVTYPTSASYGYSPFYRNTGLRSIHITDKLTEISDNEFYGCTNLKNVRIGNGVAKIGKWAFSGCSCLDYFSFGSGVKEIGQEAFSDCTAMTRLISLAPTPPVCGNQALDDINKWSCTLSVPSGHTAGYQSAEQWKEFFFISDDAESTGIGDIRTDSSDQPSGEPAIYDLYGRRLHEKPAHGFYIQGGKKYFVK